MSRAAPLPPTLRFLLAARRAELHGLENLATTCELVTRVGSLVHALQKERGYSNLYLCRPRPETAQTLAVLRDEAIGVEKNARAFLGLLLPDDASTAGKARLFSCVAHALFRLDELPDLRWRVREAKAPADEARAQFTRLISNLLAVVFEAADSALDADVTRTLVALLNFMQGKELSGQERAYGVIGYTQGYFSAPHKARMLALADSQQRNFETFVQYAAAEVLTAWEQLQAASGPVQGLRDMAQRTDEDHLVDASLAELWFELYTQRIDAMRDIEGLLAEGLAQQCRRRIAEARKELDNHRLLLSRFADQTHAETGAMLFSVQGRMLDTPPRDGVGSDMARSLLDVLREQAQRMQDADDALAQARTALEERRLVERAKWLLVSRFKLSEQAAHDRMQRAAMDGRLTLGEVARQVLARHDDVQK